MVINKQKKKPDIDVGTACVFAASASFTLTSFAIALYEIALLTAGVK